MDATAVFYNPTQEIAYLNYKRDVNLLGPVDTTRTMALYATPLGILLALPWQVNVWNKKKHTKNNVFEPAKQYLLTKRFTRSVVQVIPAGCDVT